MRKTKENRMQSYVLRARKLVQEGKNKEGAEMLSKGMNYYGEISSKLSHHMRLLMPESSLWFCIILQMTLRKTIQGQKNFACGQKTTPQNLN